MATVEERLASLEGRVEEQSRNTAGLGEAIRHLDQKVDRFRDDLSGRIDSLDQKVDRRIDGLDQKVDRFRDELSGRIDSLDQKVDRFRDELSGRLDALNRDLKQQLNVTMGLLVTLLLGVFGTLGTLLFR